tara:strand:- start:550 stop:795 length:246 start_codon:yes stop_codon:yes gene_type:complete
MKISRKKLAQIIKEEISRVLAEQVGGQITFEGAIEQGLKDAGYSGIEISKVEIDKYGTPKCAVIDGKTCFTFDIAGQAWSN